MSAVATAEMQRFTDAVTSRADDLSSLEEVLRTTNAVLTELTRYVSGAGAERLGAALPEEIGSTLVAGSPRAEGGESGDFFEAVARSEGTAPDVAAAHTQAVFRAITETADRDAITAVRDQLTPELRELFIEVDEGDTSQRLSTGPIERDTSPNAGPDRPVS